MWAITTVPHHGYPVGNSEQFFNTVRNIDDRHTILFQFPNDSNIVSTSEAENGAVGSSMIKIFAFPEIALAISTSCFWAGLRDAPWQKGQFPRPSPENHPGFFLNL